MMCLNALWQLGEGNVEEVRRVVSQGKPLAYTTVLTLLDRLARRGAVSRRKEGRGFRYQPTVERNRLRRMALKQFLDYHFDGSADDLKAFLDSPDLFDPAEEAPSTAAVSEPETAEFAAPDAPSPLLSIAQVAGDAGRAPEFPPAPQVILEASGDPAPEAAPESGM